MEYVVGALAAIVWIYILRVLTRADLPFWHFIVGAFGLFLLLMFFVRPWATEPLAQAVAAIAGFVGSITHTFEAYFLFGVIFIDSGTGAITLQIDFECSGIIEILAYLSLLSFFHVYSHKERLLVGILGTVFIILANALRMIVISEMIYFGGPDMYYVAHSLIGRVVFYVLTILLYFYVFTKPQIVRMKVGRFTYGAS